MFLGGVFNAFQLALRGALSDAVPVASTEAGAAGTSTNVERAGHSHKFPAKSVLPLHIERADPIATTSTAGSNIVLASYAIPALGAKDSLIIDAVASCDSSANAKVLGIMHATAAGQLGTAIQASSVTTSTYSRVYEELVNMNNTSKQRRKPLFSTSGTINTTAFNFGIPFWITVYANITTAGTINLEDVQIFVQRGA